MDRSNPRIGPSVALRGSRGNFNDERRSSRTLIAATVAGGLALSASLYPTPGELPIIGRIDSPGINAVLGIADRLETVMIERVVEINEAAMGKLLDVARVLMEHPNVVSVDTLLTLMETYGVDNVLEGLERIAATADILRTHTDLLNGGGGGGAPLVLPGTLSEWVLLLDMLLNRVPGQFFDMLSHAISWMMPKHTDPIVIRQLATIVAAEVPMSPPTPLPAPEHTQSVAPPLAADVPGPATPPETAAVQEQIPPPLPPAWQAVETVVITPTVSAVPTPTEVPPDIFTEVPPPPALPIEQNDPVSTVIDEPETVGSETEIDPGELDGDEDGGAAEQESGQPDSEENAPDTASSDPGGGVGEGNSNPDAGDSSPSGESTSG